MTELEIVANKIQDAKVPEEVFGIIPSSEEYKLRIVVSIYRSLLTTIHPDHYSSTSGHLVSRRAV